MTRKNLLSLALLLLATTAKAQMQTVQLPVGGDGGITLTAGKWSGSYDSYWPNNTGQTIYVHGIQPNIWSSMAVPPTANDATFYQEVADIGCFLSIWQGTDIMQIGHLGWDNHANPASPQPPPYFFPVPFSLLPGQKLHFSYYGVNGYLPIYGGQNVFNANCLVYYTIGAP